MKAYIRRIARRLARAPVIGRFVRIGVAVIRLPEFRDSLESARVSPVQVPMPSDGSTLFQSQQLPSLLQTVADINHRQIIEANAHNNLARSVPVTLRRMARDIIELRQQDMQLQSASAVAKSELADLDENIANLHNRLDTVILDAAAIRSEFGVYKNEAGQEILAARNQIDSSAKIAQEQRAVEESRLAALAGSISYLLGRVEFVRRELMFEMRYGATTPAAEGADISVKSEIINIGKVNEARASGLRLNVGCGHVPLEGYINVDRRALPGVDVVADADQLPFEPNEVAEICSKHLLEHFPLEQLRRELLPYWISLLREGGVFRAVVPDGANMARAFVSQEYTFENFRQVTFGGQDYDGDFHFNMFSVDSLKQLLIEAGLHSVEVVAENRENGGCKEFELVARR